MEGVLSNLTDLNINVADSSSKRHQSSETSEFIAHPYQISLFEEAVKQNTILYLPTGTGKTFIAVLLIKHLSPSIQRPYNQDGKRTIFIVNTVALVNQQASFVTRHTGLVVKGYSGDMNVDNWDKNTWLKEFIEAQVLVMTAQIFLNILLNGFMPLTKVNLLIFDECHRGVNNHPMRQIMQNFEKYKDNETPRVLGLSGSLLNSNVKEHKIQEMLHELEVTYHSKILTVDSLSTVTDYATNPKEILTYYDCIVKIPILENIEHISEKIKLVVDIFDIPEKLQYKMSSVEFRPDTKNSKLKRILDDILDNIKEMGIYGGYRAVIHHIIQLELIKKFCDETKLLYVLEYLITQLLKIQNLIDCKMSDCTNEKEKIYKYSSPKVLTLFEHLLNFHGESKSTRSQFCCIIFVQRRFTAQILSDVLKILSREDAQFQFLKTDYLVGFNNDPYKKPRELLFNTKKNKEVLTKFRKSLVNCIVSTDVIDEGIDIPTCTLIIRYCLPMDFRAYVQSKGRARHKTSKYILLISKENTEYTYRYRTYQKSEYILKMLHDDVNREKPTAKEIEELLYNHLHKPYIVQKPNGMHSTLTALGAISLINTYCASLVKSKFTLIIPTWVLNKADGLYQVTLSLPPISPLRKPIVGDYMNNQDDAKRSAAFKACVELHKLGELTDDLLPTRDEHVLEDTKYLFPLEEKEETKNAGTKNLKRKHKLLYPDSLCGNLPILESDKVYLHIFQLTPRYLEPNDLRHKVFYNLLSSTREFGIITKKRMIDLPEFPIFMNVGEIKVDVKNNIQLPEFPAARMKELKNFHFLIFSEILDIIHDFTVFDERNTENSSLCVPVKDYNIDWDIISQYKEIRYITPELPINVIPVEYDLNLVSPTYRSSPYVYVVTEVSDLLTASSSFPSDEFTDYCDYFDKRYQQVITNSNQPLLVVKPISKKINSLKPRGIKKHLSRRKRANLMEDFDEHLVPELCSKIDFPTVYWLKATTLPSILHRINQILLAEDLRYKISQAINLPSEQKLEPLIITDDDIEETSENNCQINNSTLDSSADDLFEIKTEESIYEEISQTNLGIDVLSEGNNLYPWENEPPDLFRNADNIQRIDIEYYYGIMYGGSSESKELDEKALKHVNQISCSYSKVVSVQVPKINLLTITNKCGPSAINIMHALTTKMANDAFNLERLETLGDSFLKYAVSLFLFEKFPSFSEGKLTFLKGKLVGNRNLYYCGKNKNLPGMLKIEDFDATRNFVTPGFGVENTIKKLINEAEVSPSILFEIRMDRIEKDSGVASQRTLERVNSKLNRFKNTDSDFGQSGIEQFLGFQTVPDKSVSDSVEAIIGSYLLNIGVLNTFKVLRWLQILPETSLTDLLYAPVRDPILPGGDKKEVEKALPLAGTLEERIGYRFKNRAFLLQAMTHPSFNFNCVTTPYQRLEFLGDAILDFLLTSYIYENCGDLSPGALTDLRSALVNNTTFACLAVKFGLHTNLLAHAPKLFELIDRFVKFQEERGFEVDDELLWILLDDEECHLIEHVDVPKVLGDIFESLIGAIFLDVERDLEKVWEVIYPLMEKEIVSFSKNVPKQPVRIVHETQGAKPLFGKSVQIENSCVVMVSLTVYVKNEKQIFHGFGSTRKLAKTAASKQALKYLR